MNKFLGISLLVDSLNMWTVCARLASGYHALKVISGNLDYHVARSAYYALIDYIAFWGVCSQRRFNSVFLLQKRALRCLCRVGYRASCRTLFIEHSILTLCCIFILNMVCLVRGKFGGQLS